MPLPSALEARVAELERERKHLLAIIEILKEVSTSLHFIDILQGIARKLGEAFGLDRCSIFLAERGGRSVRLVASYEDPTIRNYVVDLERYPELKRAMQGGETVFIPDAATDPSLKHVKGELISRRVKSITVVPITWRGVAIGAIFLRTFAMAPSSPIRTFGSCRWWPRSRRRRCATRTATSAWRSASRRRGRRCGAWSSSAWRCCRSCAACSRRSASARERGPKGCCRAPRPTSSTGWWASRWPSFKRKPRVGEGSCRPSRRAAAAHRARQRRLLRTRQAGDVRRRVRPPVPRAAGARGQASRAAHARQPHAARRRGARDGVQEAPPPRADAVARQRVQRGGARRMGKPQCPARPGGSHRRLYARSEDRRRGGESHLREGALRRRRDARERPGRRGRHGQSPNRGGRAAAAHGKGLAQADGGARRGLSLQVSLRTAQPRARAGRRADLRQPAHLHQ